MTTATKPTPGSAAPGHSTEVSWNSQSRVASVRYANGAILNKADGELLVEALEGWIGSGGELFAVLADAAGLKGTDAAYRAFVSRFFRQHQRDARIALINLGPVMRVLVDMFRLGTGVPLRSFRDEAGARSWFRTEGLPT